MTFNAYQNVNAATAYNAIDAVSGSTVLWLYSKGGNGSAGGVIEKARFRRSRASSSSIASVVVSRQAGQEGVEGEVLGHIGFLLAGRGEGPALCNNSELGARGK